MDQYAKNFNRIADCIERRASLLGREPRLIDIPEQLSIRGRVFRKSTVNAEISSVRRIMKDAQVNEGGILLHPDVITRRWISQASQEDLDHTIDRLTLQTNDILDDGVSILERELPQAMHSLGLGSEEATEILAGRVREDVARFDQKAQRYLTWRDLRSIELELSGHDPLDAILDLRENKSANIEGLLRAFMAVMWFTGMRPSEVWTSVLFIPRTDIPFTKEMADIVRTRPQHALLSKLMVPVHDAALEIRERNLGQTAWQASFQTGAPAVLMIKSAKQTNANAARRPLRFQVLERINREQLNLIGVASIARYAPISESRRDNIRSSMGRLLKKIAARDPALSDLRINLYSFRHSFASRVKLTYEAHEAAALTGHTSRQSLHHYGERNLRSSKGQQKPEQWLPSPDPERAKLILSQWETGAISGPQSDIELDD